jgi:hypothetical protein
MVKAIAIQLFANIIFVKFCYGSYLEFTSDKLIVQVG